MIHATTGGAAAAVTASPVAIDLNALLGCQVEIWSTDADIWFCGSDSSGATLVTGTTAASLTSNKADRVGSGVKAFRWLKHRYMIASTTTGPGTLQMKVVDKPAVTGIGGF